MPATMADSTQDLGFRHEALFYEGMDDFVASTTPFVREGLAADERILVAVTQDKIDALHRELGSDAEGVTFADMAVIGRNPARIIPAWQDFLSEEQGVGLRGVRGIGEPIWADRSADELIECERHEALLNLAFDGGASWQLLCPYDVRSLERETLRHARVNHPYLRTDRTTGASETYPGVEALVPTPDTPLPSPPIGATAIPFAGTALVDVREQAQRFAQAHGFSHRQDDVTMVAQELSSNSVRHGGGAGTMRIWTSDRSLLLEVQGGGWIQDPLVGRRRPGLEVGGYGLWIVNQLADLVQIRSDERGCTVRAHFS
ncbi:MAG: sensor histidine kinase [Actinomycetota bacterium]